VRRSRPSWAELTVAAAAIAVGIAAESQSYAWGDERHWLPDLATGWTLIACGVVARRRTGLLLAATGFTWFAGNFASWALVLHRGPLAHLVLTFPEGAAGVLPAVAVAYVAAAIGATWSTITLAATLAAGAAWRLLRSVGRRRREARYALRAGVALAAVLGIVATVNITSDTTSARDTALLAYQAALCAVAVYLAYGALRRPWERPAVTDLVVDLGAARTATVRDALARALGDPTLEVAYRVDGGYVDAAGRPTNLPTDTSRQVTRIERDGEEIAALVHDPAVLDGPGLVDAVAVATRLAAANARLQADVQAQVTELEASRRRLLEAADAERRRLEARLRDGAARRLGQLEARLAAARGVAGAATTPAIEQAEEQLARTVSELQHLAAGLHPHELSERGLAAAVGSLVSRSPIPVAVDVRTGRLPEQLEAAVFFVCSEALANVAKHAQASRVSLLIEEGSAAIRVEIADDGIGGAEPRSIADRVEAVGGTLTVDSPVGGGTRLLAEIPR
jgi:signal transduction histidine kinase